MPLMGPPMSTASCHSVTVAVHHVIRLCFPQALASGHALKRGDTWNHKLIVTSPLEHALTNLSEFPAMSDVGRALEVEGRLVRRRAMREHAPDDGH